MEEKWKQGMKGRRRRGREISRQIGRKIRLGLVRLDKVWFG